MAAEDFFREVLARGGVCATSGEAYRQRSGARVARERPHHNTDPHAD